jgi:hypothetical protein
MFISRADVLLRQLGASGPTAWDSRELAEAWAPHVAEPWSIGLAHELKEDRHRLPPSRSRRRGGAKCRVPSDFGWDDILATSRRSPGAPLGARKFRHLAHPGRERPRARGCLGSVFISQTGRLISAFIQGSPVTSLWSILDCFNVIASANAAGEIRRPDSEAISGGATRRYVGDHFACNISLTIAS